MPAVFDQHYVKRLEGTNVKTGKTKRELAEQLRKDIRDFKARHGVRPAGDGLVRVDRDLHQPRVRPTRRSRRSRRRWTRTIQTIAPSMLYAYAAIMEGVPFANGAPNLTCDFPAMEQLAKDRKGVPIGGKDFKTGQTMVKTVLAPMFKARMLGLAGLVLDQHPRQPRRRGARRSRELQDQGRDRSSASLEYILQPKLYPELYGDMYHKVRINYYPPRGDNKEGWDNIDIFGWLGYPMQIKVDFLCRDSILAAPLVLDLALFFDLAQRAGMRGHPGMAVVLLQEPAVRAGTLPRARPVHPADQAQEHPARY